MSSWQPLTDEQLQIEFLEDFQKDYPDAGIELILDPIKKSCGGSISGLSKTLSKQLMNQKFENFYIWYNFI